MGRHDLKACRRATGRAWAEEKIYRAISARPDVPPVPRRDDPKWHEAREYTTAEMSKQKGPNVA